MNSPLVSVIIPVYQVEKYLSDCLRCVRNQSLDNIEIICIDDGSKDNCSTILDSYANEDPRVVVFHNDNHGYGYSINYGFSKARGEYIAIYEPDDILPETALYTLYKQAKEKDLDLVKGNYCELYQLTNKSFKLVPARLHSDNDLYNNVFKASEKPEVLMSQIINCSGIFKRKLIEENNIRLSETPGASYQDVGLFFSLMLYAKSIMFISDETYWYRCDNPNSSTKSKTKLYMAEEEYKKAQDLLKMVTKDQELLAVSWSARWRGALGTFARIDDSLYNEFLGYLKPEIKEAERLGLLKKKYSNAYQNEMLKRFLRDKDYFFRGLAEAGGKQGKYFRLYCRIKNDGLLDTLRFIYQKKQMKNRIIEVEV